MDWEKVECGVGYSGVIFSLDGGGYAVVYPAEERITVVPYWLNIAKYETICSPDQIDDRLLAASKEMMNKYVPDKELLFTLRKMKGAFEEFAESQRELVAESKERQMRLYL